MPLAARPVRGAIMCVLRLMYIFEKACNATTGVGEAARCHWRRPGQAGHQGASLLVRVPSTGLRAAVGELAGRHRQRPVRVGDARVLLHGLVAPAQQELGGEQALDAHRAARVDAPRADAHLPRAGWVTVCMQP